MKVILLGLMLALVPLSALLAMDAPPPLLEAPLQLAASRLGAGGFVGGESLRGQVAYASAGRFAPRDGVPPEKVIFEIGSISKVFTSLLLAQTVIEGKVALTDPIAKFLPATLHLDPKVAAITLEQLATHTSGLPRMPDNLKRSDPEYSAAQLYEFLEGFHPTDAAPRPMSYSNLGAGLLGHLLARIHGRPYAELLAAHIAGPLGLPDTVTTLGAEQETRFAVPYSGRMKVHRWRDGVLEGAGGIHSTVADLVKFGQALLSPDSPIHPAWEMIRQPRVDTDGGGRIGLAIFVSGAGAGTYYHHNGATRGFRADFEVMPSTARVSVVLADNDEAEPGAVIAALHRPSRVRAPDTREAVPIDTAQLAAYVGNYSIDERRRFTAIIDPGKRLRLRLSGQPFGRVSYVGHDRFANRGAAAEFQFTRDAAGKIDGVTLYQRGHEIPARRTDDPVPVVLFLTPDKLQEYTGAYQLSPDTVYEISARAGHLFAKITGQPTAPVFCDRLDHFVYDVVEAALTFERDDEGAVTALVLHQNGRNARAPRIGDAP